MDFRFNDDQSAFRDALRRFCDEEIAPKAAERDVQARFEEGLVGKLSELGLFGTYVPEQYGGAGLDYITYVMSVEELSRACGATGILVSAHHSLAVDPILAYGTEEQKQKYLPKMASGAWIGCFSLTEPGSGSDAGAARCMAVEKGDHWVINGTKNFVTNGGEAHVIVLFAVSDPASKHRMSAFIVEKDTPGCTLGKLEHKLGIRASSTAELIFEDCKLPKSALLGQRGRGLNVALATLDGGRIGVSAQAVGIAQAALECGRDYANTRVQFGKPIAALQAIQWKLADMATEIAAARLLMYRVAALKQRYLDEWAAGRAGGLDDPHAGKDPKPTVGYGPEAAMAKLYASEMSNRVTNAAIQLYGGYGYCQDYPAERLMRDARITELYEGTSEIQRLVIARKVVTEPGWAAR
ncbi:MAG: acyl-CoA dehydrogenase family protein [Planctomycetota bacterium]